MSLEPSRRFPYFDWRLDRWKIGVALLLFILLGIGWFRRLTPAGPTVFVQPTQEPTATLFPQTTQTTTVTPSVTATIALAPQETPPVATERPIQAEPTSTPIPAAIMSLALTLSNVAPNSSVAANSIAVLRGTAASGQPVRITDSHIPYTDSGQLLEKAVPQVILGTVQADSNGRWELPLAEPLAPGLHRLFAHQLGDRGQTVASVGPIPVNVLPDALPLPQQTIPLILMPARGAHLINSTPVFTGQAAPGSLLRLFLNDRSVADVIADRAGKWRIVTEHALSTGSYVAKAMVLSTDEVGLAQSPPIAFLVLANAQPLQAPSLNVEGGTTLPPEDRTPRFFGQAVPGMLVAVSAIERAMVVQADEQGNWRLTWQHPLPIGMTWVTAQIVDALGRPQTERASLIVNVVPAEAYEAEREKMPEPVERAAPTATPSATPAGEMMPSGPTVITALAGSARPDARLFIYVDGEWVGEVRGGEAGHWYFELPRPLRGRHDIHVLEVDDAGRPVAVSARPPTFLPITGDSAADPPGE